MARVAPNPHGPDGPTLFLCDGQTPGIELERVMDTMDRNYVEGHGVVQFNDLRLPASAVLGEVGQALRYAQLRLTPARLTHCMRWLGAASRAHSIAIEHARTRTGFGKPLGEHQVWVSCWPTTRSPCSSAGWRSGGPAGRSIPAPKADTRARW